MQVLPGKRQEKCYTGRYLKWLGNQNGEYICESKDFETQELDAFGKGYHLKMHEFWVTISDPSSFKN